jgi:hypothetical protein
VLFSGRLAATVGDSLSACIYLPLGFEREKCKSFLVYCFFQQHKSAATTGGQPVRWGNAFLVKQGARFFLFNEKGDLIIARLTPAGYEEVSRAHLLEPTNQDPGRPVVWSHPAFANRSVYARNDQEIICVSLAR